MPSYKLYASSGLKSISYPAKTNDTCFVKRKDAGMYFANTECRDSIDLTFLCIFIKVYLKMKLYLADVFSLVCVDEVTA